MVTSPAAIPEFNAELAVALTVGWAELEDVAEVAASTEVVRELKVGAGVTAAEMLTLWQAGNIDWITLAMAADWRSGLFWSSGTSDVGRITSLIAPPPAPVIVAHWLFGPEEMEVYNAASENSKYGVG